jgi:hypothetical protein
MKVARSYQKRILQADPEQRTDIGYEVVVRYPVIAKWMHAQPPDSAWLKRGVEKWGRK